MAAPTDKGPNGTSAGVVAVTAADSTTVRVRIAIAAFALGALLALPASASAGQGGAAASVAAQQCAQERSVVGKRGFRKRYGAKHTMRTCIRRNRGKAATAVNSATADCQTELSQDGADQFILDWAWDEDTVDDAMSECVADGIDTILNPDDSGDDETDDE
jgi:hypothetical protein